MVINLNDGMGVFQRPDSLQRNEPRSSSIHIGIVTAVSAATNTAFVRIPSINDGAELGPYKCLELFTRIVQTPVKQTLTTTSATVSGTSVLTSATLSSTTTNLQGVYGNLNLPDVGQRVLVVLINDSLDQGVLVGKL